MIDWLYRRRDPAAIGTTLVTIAALWASWRLAPQVLTKPPPAPEMAVKWEDLPPPAPPPPPPPPPPVTRPPPPPPTAAPTPAAQTPPSPAPAPTTSPTATETAPPAPAAPAPPAPAPPAPAPPAPAPPAPAPPAPAPAPPPAPAAPARNAEDAYRGELRSYLNSIKRYPNSREARQLRPQGTVRIWIELDRAGQLQNAGVEAGSGSLLLDNEALRTVRNGRYPAFPADSFSGQGSHRFVVPIEYTTESTN